MEKSIASMQDKKDLRKTANRIAISILIYQLIIFGIGIVDAFVRMAVEYAKHKESSEVIFDKIKDGVVNSGTSSIVGVFIGLLFLLIVFRKAEYKKGFFSSNKKMTGAMFFMILVVFMSVQFMFNILGFGCESCLNHFGYTILGDVDEAAARSTTISMLLYASFIGPISEEIIFRGFILRGLQRFGSYFAIVVSAIIFGLFHGNLIQGIFATVVGLVFGYVTLNYSIIWSIVLHIMNNFIFGDVISYLIRNMSDASQNMILSTMNVMFFLGMIIILIVKRKQIKNGVKEIKIDKNKIFITFTSILMLLFSVFQIYLGVSGITKLAA